MMKGSTIRNCSIDIFRYICAILVIMIHTSVFADLNAQISFVWVDVIPRIAVPFFFAVAGFFYTGKLEQGKKPFVPYLKKLLLTYTAWSAVYFATDYITWGHGSIKSFMINCLRTFFVDGSHYHLWFFVALIFSVCVVTAAYKIKCAKLLLPVSGALYLVGCLGCAYYSVGATVPCLNRLFDSAWYTIVRRYLLMGFPFFVLGLTVRKLQKKLTNISDKTMLCLLVSAIVLWAVELLVVIRFGLQRDIILSAGLYPMTACLLLVLLRKPIPNASKPANICRTLAGFSYYAHPLIIEALRSGFSISETPMFLITVLSTTVVGYGIYKVNNKYLNILAN